MQSNNISDLLTTGEVAAYLRLKERTVYELVRTRRIPCTRATGKWLFPKLLIDQWLLAHVELRDGPIVVAPPVVAGSHDPLLEWALGESGSDLALLANGSVDGLDRLMTLRARIAALHLLDPESGEYNIAAVRAHAEFADLVLIAWAEREQGLVVAAGNPLNIRSVADLATRPARIARRQEGAGAHVLFRHLLDQAGLHYDRLNVLNQPARNETEIATMVLDGKADCGLAIAAVAQRFRLGFIPLRRERIDLAVRRRDYFEPPMQALLAFARTPAFHERARELGGYDVGATGRVVFNA